MSDNETLADIVREMRKDADNEDSCWMNGISTKYYAGLADRIEAAYARLPLLTPEQWTAFARQGSENAELRRENAELRTALGQEEARK